MGRKVVCLFTLFAFFVFSYSCTKTVTRKIEVVAKWKTKKIARVKVLAVMKKNGEKIEFSKFRPGIIVRGGVERRLLTWNEEKEIDLSKIHKIFRSNNGEILWLLMKNGRKIRPDYAEQKKDKIIIYTGLKYVPVIIPFSEIDSVKIKVSASDFSVAGSVILGYLGLCAVFVFGLFVFFKNMK